MSIFKDMSVTEILNYGLSYNVPYNLSVEAIKNLINSREEKKELKKIILDSKKNYIKLTKLDEIFVDYLFNGDNALGIVDDYNRNYIGINFYNFILTTIIFIFGKRDDFVDIYNLINVDDYIKNISDKLKSLKKEINSTKTKRDFQKLTRDYENIYLIAKDKIDADKFYDIFSYSTQHPTYLNDLEESIIVEMRRCVNSFINYLSGDTAKSIDFGEKLDKLKTLDKDKFALYLAMNIMWSIEPDENTDIFSNSIYYVINVYLTLKDEIEPNTRIKFDNMSLNGTVDATFKDFENKLIKYVAKHKELRFEKIDENFFSEDWSISEMDEYLTALNNETMEYFDEVDPDRIFIPNSTNGGKVYLDENFEEIEMPTLKESKENTENLRLVAEKREFYAKNISHIYKTLMGKNKFKGYIANIFDNGYVIFEKYDESIEDISKKTGAAYIMTINNFNKLCTLTIREIREIVQKRKKDNDESHGFVSYKVHKGDWQKVLQEYIDEDTQVSLKDRPDLLSI